MRRLIAMFFVVLSLATWSSASASEREWQLYSPLIGKGLWKPHEWFAWRTYAVKLQPVVKAAKRRKTGTERELLDSVDVWVGKAIEQVDGPPADGTIVFDPDAEDEVNALRSLFDTRERELLLLIRILDESWVSGILASTDRVALLRVLNYCLTHNRVLIRRLNQALEERDSNMI